MSPLNNRGKTERDQIILHKKGDYTQIIPMDIAIFARGEAHRLLETAIEIVLACKPDILCDFMNSVTCHQEQLLGAVHPQAVDIIERNLSGYLLE